VYQSRRHLSPRGLHERTWKKGSFTGDPERYVKQGSGMGTCFHRGPTPVSIEAPLLGNMEGRSFLKAFNIQRYIKRYVKLPCKQVYLSIGALLGNLEGIRLLGLLERKE
jgi:hypothetical protein